MHFVDVFIRQAHPGELRGPYHSYEEKLAEAREYKREEGIEWPVLVDDYVGRVHRTYSREMADPVFLIDGCVEQFGDQDQCARLPTQPGP